MGYAMKCLILSILLICMSTELVAQYGQPTYSSGTTTGSWIKRVQLGSIDNNTGASAAPYYTLFSSPPATNTTVLVRGCSYTCRVMTTTVDVPQTIAVFLDLNGNSNWDLPVEKIGEVHTGSTPFATISFTIPTTATVGTTRLRIIDRGSATSGITPTVSTIAGECEDYSVTISALASGVSDIDVKFPNVGSLPIQNNGTVDVGSIPSGIETALFFNVENQGSSSLTFPSGSVAISTTPAPVNCTFGFISPGSSSVSSMNSKNVIVRVTPAASATHAPFSFTFTITSNDPDENPYTINVIGTAIGFTYTSALPFVENFDSTISPSVVLKRLYSNDYPNGVPTATTIGGTITMNTTVAKDAQIQIGSIEASLQSPFSAPNQLSIDFPGTSSNKGCGAVDFHFDLSAYTVTSDVLRFSFRWSTPGDDSDIFDGVFVSTDGGITWQTCIYKFPFTGNFITYSAAGLVDIDLSAALSLASLNYTNQVIIRIQCSDNDELWEPDGVVIDDVKVEVQLAPQEIDVMRGAVQIIDGGTDSIGSLYITGQPISISYSVMNIGGMDLDITGQPVIVPNNCTVTVLQGLSSVITAGLSSVTTLEITPIAPGSFSFSYSLPSSDTDENPYNWTADGVSSVPLIPECDVFRGVPVDNGTIDNVIGVTATVPSTLIYTISNSGTADLIIATPVAAAFNLVNCSVNIITQPNSNVVAGNSTTIVVTFTPTNAGTFSFELAFATNDSNENPYGWSVSGTAAALPPQNVSSQDSSNSSCTTTERGVFPALLVLSLIAIIGIGFYKKA